MKNKIIIGLMLGMCISMAACGEPDEAAKKEDVQQEHQESEKSDVPSEQEETDETDEEVKDEVEESEIGENEIPLLADDTGLYNDEDGVYEIPFGVKTDDGEQMFFNAKISANAILNGSGIDALGEEDHSLLSAGKMKSYNENGMLKDISMKEATFIDNSGMYKMLILPFDSEEGKFYFDTRKDWEQDAFEIEDENLPAYVCKSINDEDAIYITVNLSEEYYLDLAYSGDYVGSMDYKELAEKLYGLISSIN